MSQITTHVLNTAHGMPAAGLAIQLSRREGDSWTVIAEGTTDSDGRISDLCPADTALPAGVYQMHFATGDYFAGTNQSDFYPWADVVFRLDDSGDHYHIPLLLAPYGYSTYRGS